jgi:hypothetical protein
MCVSATPAAAQYRSRIVPDSVVQLDREPPLSAGIVAVQLGAGIGGGFAGALVAFLPLALSASNGDEPGETLVVVSILSGFYIGSVVSVKLASAKLGMDGSWTSTFTGAAIGVIGGPAVLVTMPLGAVIGFNRSRRPKA